MMILSSIPDWHECEAHSTVYESEPAWERSLFPLNSKMWQCKGANAAWRLLHQIWEPKLWVSIRTQIGPDSRQHAACLKSAALTARERREPGHCAPRAATAGFRWHAEQLIHPIKLHRKRAESGLKTVTEGITTGPYNQRAEGGWTMRPGLPKASNSGITHFITAI